MKVSRKQLRKLILREFKFTGEDFTDKFISDPPPVTPDTPEPPRGGGGGQLHQLIRLGFDEGSEFDPSSYSKSPIDMSPGSPFALMREIYSSFSNQTKNALYQMFPGGVSEEDQDDIWEFRSAYINLLNTMDAALPVGRDYEYFTVFHPDYASHGGEDDASRRRALDLYRAVTGYTVNEELLNEYEILMHSASAMY